MTGNDKGEVVEKLFDAVSHDDLEKVKTIVESEGVSLVKINHNCDDTEETLAHVAARRGNLEMLMYLLEKDSSLLEKNEDGPLRFQDRLTLLETAVKYGHLHVVKYLVESHNDDIFRARFAYPSYRSPVTLAISEGHLNIVKYFIDERRVDIDTGGPQRTDQGRWHPYHSSRSLLFPAIAWKRDNITMYLIDEGNANLTVLSHEKNQNILYGAQLHDNLDLMKYVLDEKRARIDIDWRDSDGKTLLYSAVESGHQDILQYLIEQKRANMNIPCYKEKLTPLHRAIRWCNEAFEFLIDHGAYLDARDESGATPLHFAAALKRNRSEHCTKYLLERGANLRLENNKKQTPLDVSIAEMNLGASKYLIDYSGNVNERNAQGTTLVHKVAARNQTDLLDYLVRVKHADINIPREKDKWTPLHCAAVWDLPNVCEYLIEHGADPQAKDNKGRTPAQLAPTERISECIRNATAKLRSRRCVVDHTSIFQRPEPKNYARRIPGTLCVGASSLDEVPGYHFQSFLAITNFVIQYLFHSTSRTSRIIGNYSLNEVQYMAEDAIETFMDSEEDEI